MTRQEEIRKKGFNMIDPFDYGEIKVGVKTLKDAYLNLGTLKTVNKSYNSKDAVVKALADKDIDTLIAISNYFYRTSGIYFRACNYFANLYRYDWYVVPEYYGEKVNANKMKKEFANVLNCLDNSCIKKTCGNIALSVIVNGAF